MPKGDLPYQKGIGKWKFIWIGEKDYGYLC
jgi:hypothetical protein